MGIRIIIKENPLLEIAKLIARKNRIILKPSVTLIFLENITTQAKPKYTAFKSKYCKSDQN